MKRLAMLLFALIMSCTCTTVHKHYTIQPGASAFSISILDATVVLPARGEATCHGTIITYKGKPVVLTSAHCISSEITPVQLRSGTVIPTKTLKKEDLPGIDLALLYFYTLTPKLPEAARIGNTLIIGQWVWKIGVAKDGLLPWSVAHGSISNLSASDTMLLFNGVSMPGDSGGGVFSLDGKLVCVTAAMTSLAIPVPDFPLPTKTYKVPLGFGACTRLEIIKEFLSK